MRGNLFRILPLLLPLVLLAFRPGPALAVELTPFATRNQSPLVQIYGLPTAEPAEVLDKGRVAVGLLLDVANNFTSSAGIGESVLLDGETYGTTLTLRYGLSDRFELGVDVPYFSRNGGFLDGFIDGFHDSFGFPDGDRNKVPRDQLNFTYQRSGQTLISQSGSDSGLGDLRLSAAMLLLRETGARPGSAVLRLSLKLPTGDSDKLFGSGSTDIALAIAGQREFPADWGRFSAYASLGGLLISDSEVLEKQHRNLAGFGSLGLGWAPLDWLALKIQADAHTAFYKNSELDEISSHSVQLVTGGTLQLAERTSLDLAVSEDVMVNTSPDVVFHLALRQVF